MNEIEISALKAGQRCFPLDDYWMLCNFIVKKDGTIIRGRGKYLRFRKTKGRVNSQKEKEPDKDSDSSTPKK